MDFDEYQRRARATDQNPKLPADPAEISRDPRRDEVLPLLGLVGEVGGLLAEYKKLLRDGATHRKFRDEVAEELGDILWYVANVATKFDLTLEEIARSNIAKVEDRWRGPERRRILYDDTATRTKGFPGSSSTASSTKLSTDSASWSSSDSGPVWTTSDGT
jgi:NTP pyrophosphatase (non-canonical NTP hydrolase)